MTELATSTISSTTMISADNTLALLNIADYTTINVPFRSDDIKSELK